MKGLYTEPVEAADELNVCLDSSAIKFHDVSRVAVMGKGSQCAPWNRLCEILATKHKDNEIIGNIQLCFLNSWNWMRFAVLNPENQRQLLV